MAYDPRVGRCPSHTPILPGAQAPTAPHSAPPPTAAGLTARVNALAIECQTLQRRAADIRSSFGRTCVFSQQHSIRILQHRITDLQIEYSSIRAQTTQFSSTEQIGLMRCICEVDTALEQLHTTQKQLSHEAFQTSTVVKTQSPQLQQLLSVAPTLPHPDVASRTQRAVDVNYSRGKDQPVLQSIDAASNAVDSSGIPLACGELRKILTQTAGYGTIRLNNTSNPRDSRLTMDTSGALGKVCWYVSSSFYTMQEAAEVVYNACLREIDIREKAVNSTPSAEGSQQAAKRSIEQLTELLKAVDMLIGKYTKEEKPGKPHGVATLRQTREKLVESIAKLQAVVESQPEVEILQKCAQYEAQITSIRAIVFSGESASERFEQFEASIPYLASCLEECDSLIQRCQTRANYQSNPAYLELQRQRTLLLQAQAEFTQAARTLQADVQREEANLPNLESTDACVDEHELTAARMPISAIRTGSCGSLEPWIDQQITQITQAVQASDYQTAANLINSFNPKLFQHPKIIQMLRQVAPSFERRFGTEPCHANTAILKAQQRIWIQKTNDCMAAILQGDDRVSIPEELVRTLNSISHSRCDLDPYATMSYAAAHRYLSTTPYASRLLPVCIKVDPSNQLGCFSSLIHDLQYNAPGKHRWLHIGGTLLRGGVAKVAVNGSNQLKITATLPSDVRASLEPKLTSLCTARYRVTTEPSGYSSSSGARVEAGLDTVVRSTDGRITLRVGCNKQYWNQYEKISIEVANDVSPDELQGFLSGLGLSQLMLDSRQEDIIQVQLARLAQAKYPRENISSLEGWVRLGLRDRDLVRRAQTMQAPHNADLSQEVDATATAEFKAAGGIGFGMTVGFGKTLTLWEMATQFKAYEVKAVDSADKAGNYDGAGKSAGYMCHGCLSSVERYERGIVGTGCCADENIQTGSGNQVFARALTQNQVDQGADWTSYAIPGSVFMLVKPQAAERLPYAYTSDRSGLRSEGYQAPRYVRIPQKEYPSLGLRPENISERVSLPELAQVQMARGTLATGEVMFEQLLGSQYVVGMMVATEEEKRRLIAVLTSDQARREGFYIDNINGRPLDKCIIVSRTINKEAQGLLNS